MNNIFESIYQLLLDGFFNLKFNNETIRTYGLDNYTYALKANNRDLIVVYNFNSEFKNDGIKIYKLDRCTFINFKKTDQLNAPINGMELEEAFQFILTNEYASYYNVLNEIVKVVPDTMTIKIFEDDITNDNLNELNLKLREIVDVRKNNESNTVKY